MTEVTDPVCGMQFDAETAEDLGATILEHEGEKRYFCCPTCADEFQKDPARYT